MERCGGTVVRFRVSLLLFCCRVLNQRGRTRVPPCVTRFPRVFYVTSMSHTQKEAAARLLEASGWDPLRI